MPDVRFFRTALFILPAMLAALTSPLSGQTPVRIVAANITSGNGQDYQAPGTRILQALDADVVLIQEFNVPGANDTAAVSSWVSSTFGPGFVAYREPGNQSIPNGVISRYPFVETGEWDDVEVGDRDFAWARIDVPGPKDLWAVSVHLKTSSSTTQNAQVQEILVAMQAKGIPATDYVVIGGDFNTSGRTVAPLTTLNNSAWDFVTGAPYPTGENNDPDTNANRSSPYDWVLPDNALNAIKTQTLYAPTVNLAQPTKTYGDGLVFDTRDFAQSTLNEYFPPALLADSGATNMQHMAVVRTFLFPGVPTPVQDGTVATVSFTDRAPVQAQSGTEIAMLSIVVSVGSAEWDAGSISMQRLGTTVDAQVTVQMYIDNDNSGSVTAGDQLVGNSAFAGGMATLALGSPAPRATSGSPIRLLATAVVSAGATSGSTVQLRAVSNGFASAPSGGVDPNPTYAAFTSAETLITGDPAPPPPPAGAAVVVNKYFNHGSIPAQDVIELLVVQDGLDLRGMIVKDHSSSMANDGGGKFAFSSNSLWSSVRAGTLIVLRNDNSAADTTASGSDYKLDVGIANSTWFTSLGGALDLAGIEMVTVKAAGSGAAGSTQAIHSLSGGTPGAQYTAAPVPKLNSATGAGTGQYLFATSTGPIGNSRISNYTDGSGTAAVSASALTFGSANNVANGDFIAILRGTTTTGATGIASGQFTANWTLLTAAARYHLDVARDLAFTSYVAGYSQFNVGNTASYGVTGLSDGNYYYRVRAVDADGTVGGASNTTAVTVAGASTVVDWSIY